MLRLGRDSVSIMINLVRAPAPVTDAGPTAAQAQYCTTRHDSSEPQFAFLRRCALVPLAVLGLSLFVPFEHGAMLQVFPETIPFRRPCFHECGSCSTLPPLTTAHLHR